LLVCRRAVVVPGVEYPAKLGIFGFKYVDSVGVAVSAEGVRCFFPSYSEARSIGRLTRPTFLCSRASRALISTITSTVAGFTYAYVKIERATDVWTDRHLFATISTLRAAASAPALNEASIMRGLADRTPAFAAGACVHRFDVVAIAAVPGCGMVICW
jgi:hypothetical protein